MAVYSRIIILLFALIIIYLGVIKSLPCYYFYHFVDLVIVPVQARKGAPVGITLSQNTRRNLSTRQINRFRLGKVGRPRASFLIFVCSRGTMKSYKYLLAVGCAISRKAKFVSRLLCEIS